MTDDERADERKRIHAKVKALPGVLTAKIDGESDALLWRSTVLALLRASTADEDNTTHSQRETLGDTTEGG